MVILGHLLFTPYIARSVIHWLTFYTGVPVSTDDNEQKHFPTCELFCSLYLNECFYMDLLQPNYSVKISTKERRVPAPKS